MGVLFNSIPGSGLVAPLFAFEINSGGAYESNARMLLVGHKISAGSLADNSFTVCSSEQEAAGFCGAGSQLYEMFRIARRAAPAQEIWIAPVPATGVAPTWTVTVVANPAGGGTGYLVIAGRVLQIAIAAGEAIATTAANIVAAVNAYVDTLTLAYLPVTASAAGAVVTLTSRHAGAQFAEIEVAAPATIANNVFSSGSNLTIATGVVGSGNPSLTTLFGSLGDEPFDWIVSPLSQTTDLDAAVSLLDARWGYDRQIYGHYVTVTKGSTSANTTYGLARSTARISVLGVPATITTPSWEWLVGEIAPVVPWLIDDTNGNAARNQTGIRAAEVIPPRDRSLWPNYPARNTLNKSGISTWIQRNGQILIDKWVTMYRLGPQGQPDTTFRDIQAIAQIMAGVRFIRAYLQTRHGNKSIADANPGDLPAISTVADIAADTVAAYGETVRRGLFENVKGMAEALVVERDAGNPNRVNVGLRMDLVNPLDIMAGNATILRQFAQSNLPNA